MVDTNGDFHVIRSNYTYKTRSDEEWKAEAEAQWEALSETAVHTFTFGPALVLDGVEITPEEIQAISLNLGKGKSTQRIAICQMDTLQYLIVATEGPECDNDKGLTLQEMADLCYSLGCKTAYNLDGGSSATVVLGTTKINSRTNTKRRPVGDCIWFATMIPND